jgi:hypothetical protein
MNTLLAKNIHTLVTFNEERREIRNAARAFAARSSC